MYSNEMQAMATASRARPPVTGIAAAPAAAARGKAAVHVPIVGGVPQPRQPEPAEPAEPVAYEKQVPIADHLDDGGERKHRVEFLTPGLGERDHMQTIDVIARWRASINELGADGPARYWKLSPQAIDAFKERMPDGNTEQIVVRSMCLMQFDNGFPEPLTFNVHAGLPRAFHTDKVDGGSGHRLPAYFPAGRHGEHAKTLYENDEVLPADIFRKYGKMKDGAQLERGIQKIEGNKKTVLYTVSENPFLGYLLARNHRQLHADFGFDYKHIWAQHAKQRLPTVQVNRRAVEHVIKLAKLALDTTKKHTTNAADLALQLKCARTADGGFGALVSEYKDDYRASPGTAEMMLDQKYTFEAVLRIEYMFPAVAYGEEEEEEGDDGDGEEEDEALKEEEAAAMFVGDDLDER